MKATITIRARKVEGGPGAPDPDGVLDGIYAELNLGVGSMIEACNEAAEDIVYEVTHLRIEALGQAFEDRGPR